MGEHHMWDGFISTKQYTHFFCYICYTFVPFFLKVPVFRLSRPGALLILTSFVPYEHANSLNKLKLLCAVCLFYMEQYQLTFSVMNSHTKGGIYLFFNMVSF